MTHTENLRAGEKELVWGLDLAGGYQGLVFALELTHPGHAQRSPLERGTLERIFNQCSVISFSFMTNGIHCSCKETFSIG